MRTWVSGRTGMVLAFIAGAAVASAATAGAASLVTGKQIKDGSISTKDLSKALQKQLARTGAAGATGATGAQGPVGPAGPAGATGPSTGVAGGDLSGNFPNPQIAAGAVRSSELGTITDRTAVSAAIANGASGSVAANCQPGEKVISGGWDGFISAGYNVVGSRAEEDHGWGVFLQNNTGSSQSITAHAYCLAP